MDRMTEIRQLLKLSPQEVRRQAGRHLVVCDDIESLIAELAPENFTKLSIGPGHA